MPSQSIASRIASIAACVLRSRSVSSIRRMNLPPRRRAYSQQYSAVRAPPMCRKPVGLGAKRVRQDMGRLGVRMTADFNWFPSVAFMPER
jgi:hypothetical protein